MDGTGVRLEFVTPTFIRFKVDVSPQAGQLTHAGKRAVFGLGRYRIGET
jgi:hypothetical protein